MEKSESPVDRSSDPSLTRAQFVKKLVHKAMLAGTIAAAPAVIDSFSAPPAQAAVSGGGPPP